MKKTLPALVLFTLLVALFVPLTAAASPEKCTLKHELKDVDPACTRGASVEIETHGFCCALNTIYNITDWIFVFLLALATVYAVLGAYHFLSAAGSPEKITLGRNYIIYAAVGIAVGFLAKAVPGIVKLLVGV